MGYIALQDYLRHVDGLLDENRLEEAAAHCYSILQQQPRHVATYRLFGRVLLEQQKYAPAIDVFQRVLSADPEDLIAHAGLAEAYRGMEDLPSSMWHMERAFEIQPYNRVVQSELRTLNEVRDGFAPEQVSLTRAALARLYVRGGRFRLAADELRALLADDSDRVDLRVLLAEALYWDDRRLEAARVCASVMEELSDSIKANAILADVWASGGGESEARQFIERLWSLTLLDRLERDSETLIGRALSHGKFVKLPEQVLVEKLEHMPETIEESAVNFEPSTVLSAVAVKELPGWLEEIEEAHFEEALTEFSTQESVDDQELPGPVASIDAETTLLLESEADGDAESQSEEGLSAALGTESTGKDEPFESAETLVGEDEVAQEEVPADEPEPPIEASDEGFEKEVVQQTNAEPVIDDGLPRESAPVEPDLSPEELFLESIVAEAFGELAPIESSENEPATSVVNEEESSALEAIYPPDDISLEEIAAEAFEQEIAPEQAEDFAQERGLAPQETAPGQERIPDDPTMEGSSAGAEEEAELRSPGDEGSGGTDLLFAALVAREVKGKLPETGEETAVADGDEESGRIAHSENFGQEAEPTSEGINVEPPETSVEDHIFESLTENVETEDAIGWPKIEPESVEDVNEYPDLPEEVNEEFDDFPEEFLPADREARPDAAILGALAAEATDDSLEGWLQDLPDEGGVTEPDGGVANNDLATDPHRNVEAETWQEDSVEATSIELADDVVILSPSDIVTKEFDGPPDVSFDPVEPSSADATPLPESTGPTLPDSQMQEAIFEDFSPVQEDTPLESPANDVVVDSPEVESSGAFPTDDAFDVDETHEDGDSSDWLDDLSEDSTDMENLPDWLYDAIGFTGELESPDEYEDPGWLGELDGDGEETLRESQPKTDADVVRHRSEDVQNIVSVEAEATNFGGASPIDEEEIPDWLEEVGGSLEELPADLVENLGISGSDVGDEDDGALSWLEELAAEPPTTGTEKGLKNAGDFDRSVKKRPRQPNESTDSDSLN